MPLNSAGSGREKMDPSLVLGNNVQSEKRRYDLIAKQLSLAALQAAITTGMSGHRPEAASSIHFRFNLPPTLCGRKKSIYSDEGGQGNSST